MKDELQDRKNVLSGGLGGSDASCLENIWRVAALCTFQFRHVGSAHGWPVFTTNKNENDSFIRID
jgi:hypothetical protein